MSKEISILQNEAVELLKELIATPSFSKEEDQTAGILCRFLGNKDIVHTRVGNNVFALNKHFDEKKSTILLNSHHDTVKPNPQYSNDPFKYNLILAATAEEEISGSGGIEYTLPYLPKIDFAIVGEPTQMQMAVAERGLMVLDCIAHGKAGHAARNEGENAIYKAMKDIEWFSTYQFNRVSELLGASKMSVTVIETENKAHNVVPALCKFVVDTRINELYSFEEVIDIIKANVQCEVMPRSTRLRSTSIALDHPLVKAGLNLGCAYYGSPTTSDKALMPFPALKMGPGDSARSHTANEYIYIDEIKKGIELYIQLLNQIV
ncbi:MAG: M20/M25/M40 family metallo-hydrolase [Chitinophagaceae bacterium]|nr:M20/M25/M40 family metallo-hydrolase [Chitinophagaceae bacterium]